MRVLLTRPQGSGDALTTALQQRGAQILHVPLLTIAPLSPESDAQLIAGNRRLLAQIERYDALVFISTNAVKFFRAALEKDTSDIPPCFAIGPATAQAAASAGFTVLGTGRNTETLLALPELDARVGTLLIVRGVGGRELLAETLRERGKTVDYLDCYRRAPAAIPAAEFAARVARFRCNLAVAYSGETVAALDRLLTAAGTAKLRAMPLVVPGPRVAKIASDAGFSAVIAAADAGADSMLQAVSSVTAATSGD